MVQNTKITGRILSVQKIIVNGDEVTPTGKEIDSDNIPLSSTRFGGYVYENEHTMTDDLPYQFTSTSLKLRGAVVLVSTHPVLIGDSVNQRYPKSAATIISIGDVDLSTLYFKNAGAGDNVKLNIIGVRL